MWSMRAMPCMVGYRVSTSSHGSQGPPLNSAGRGADDGDIESSIETISQVKGGRRSSRRGSYNQARSCETRKWLRMVVIVVAVVVVVVVGRRRCRRLHHTHEGEGAECWLVGWLVGWLCLFCHSVICLFACVCVFVWLIVWLAGCLFGWLLGWSGGPEVGGT